MKRDWINEIYGLGIIKVRESQLEAWIEGKCKLRVRDVGCGESE